MPASRAHTTASGRAGRVAAGCPRPRPGFSSTLLAPAVALALLAGCSIGGGSDSGDRSYLSEERCQPVDDMNDPSDGSIPSPEELLPDPQECPEFYEGGGPGTAPPVSGVVPVDPGVSPQPIPPPEDPCASGASLNGFPCTDGPNGPIYITPDPSGPD